MAMLKDSSPTVTASKSYSYDTFICIEGRWDSKRFSEQKPNIDNTYNYRFS